MSKFPIDAAKNKVLKTFEHFGFYLIREKEHISMIRKNSDGSSTPLTLPNHLKIKGSTLRSICTQCGIPRDEFIDIFQKM
jgi:hypothetical protein